ncbi:MAG: hypothetical protein PVF35_04005 [Gammaproteobacteria bacterium]
MFSALFDYYRYPAIRGKSRKRNKSHDDHYPPIAHTDMVYALSHIDTIVPVSEEDLINIYELAAGREHAAKNQDLSSG